MRGNTFIPKTKEWFMFEAYKEAKKGYGKRECPIGVVIVKDGEIIARAHNNKEAKNDPLGHAEVIAIKKASKKLCDWRLTGCDMYVTLEPCTMCAGAIILARIRHLYMGTKDPKAGAVVSVFRILDEDLLNHKVSYDLGILENECMSILKAFFKELRIRNKQMKLKE